MKREEIDILVNKYINAESTRDEEALLKSTLLSDNTPPEFNDLKALFSYFELKNSQTDVPVFHNPAIPGPHRKTKFFNLSWFAVAASIAIIVLAYLFVNKNSNSAYPDTYSDPEVAAQNATEALQLLSGELNKGGTIAIEQMKEFDNLNKYLKIF